MKISANETVTNKVQSIRKILVAVDLSDHSEATAFYAAETAKYFRRIGVWHSRRALTIDLSVNRTDALETTLDIWKSNLG